MLVEADGSWSGEVVIPAGTAVSTHRVEARCVAENTASARVMEKAGMTYEGTLRQREFLKGAYRDIKLYAILRGEYR